MDREIEELTKLIVKTEAEILLKHQVPATKTDLAQAILDAGYRKENKMECCFKWEKGFRGLWYYTEPEELREFVERKDMNLNFCPECGKPLKQEWCKGCVQDSSYYKNGKLWCSDCHLPIKPSEKTIEPIGELNSNKQMNLSENNWGHIQILKHRIDKLIEAHNKRG